MRRQGFLSFFTVFFLFLIYKSVSLIIYQMVYIIENTFVMQNFNLYNIA